MKKPLVFHLLALFIFGSGFSMQAKEPVFIYGKITTFMGDTYEGQILWGDEEAFKTDLFKAAKVYNDNIDYLSDEEIVQLKKEKLRYQNDGIAMIESLKSQDKSEYSFIHMFRCQFGEIKNIKMTKWRKAELEMNDGKRVTVAGDEEGYYDIGAKITVYDEKKGKVNINWMEIDNVEFMKEPHKFESAIGEPLYGTVYTTEGIYSGIIYWDQDERVTTDELDAESQEGKFRVAFGEIQAIQQHREGSLVTLKNGERTYVFGTNDVNQENRGIVVTNDDIGRIAIKWSEFEKVEFLNSKPPQKNVQKKAAAPREITGTVKTKSGKIIKGKIVFDLDEQYDYEMLNGETQRMEFEIPFRNIKKITPQGERKCVVQLRSQKQFYLRDSQDVTFKNEGLLVFENHTNPIYISWREVEEVVFN